MSYFERYQEGDQAGVWQDLVALGPAVRSPEILRDANSVASLTMERVLANIERIVARLTSHGYQFGVYPDGSPLPLADGPLCRTNPQLLAEIEELEALAGTVPLSLRAFWQVVGGVNLVGRFRTIVPEYADPLWVEPPRAGLVDLADQPPEAADERFCCPIAPDCLHKDNISGGLPYSIRLPDAGADALVSDEWHDLAFVPYLRVAILEWGGFPGLSQANPFNKWRKDSLAAPEWLRSLKDGLVPF